ncbi:TPA: cyclase family protein [Campylobacter jejuni]
MFRYINLSHELSRKLKYYKSSTMDLVYNEIVQIDRVNRDTNMKLNSHMGTHIDYPAHYIENGKFGDEYSVDYLFSKNVFLVDIDLKNQEFPQITKQFLIDTIIPKNIEILIVKTHFSDIRDSDRYIWNSPVIDSEIPLYLKKQFPFLRAICLDVISITSQLNREEGKKCHINFLSNENGHEILIIEDANLQCLQKSDSIKEIFILPLKFERMDGSPCSIVAKIKKRGCL